MKNENALFGAAIAENSVGWLSIFRTVACIGDSLSSGELVSRDADGKNQYNDFYEYSWGQFLARKYGINVHNFSRGGMTAREYMTTFADGKRFFSPRLAAQAYYIALGVNDLLCQNHEIGSADDMYAVNPDTFAGYFAAIIKKYKELQPRAKFFLITMPREYRDDERKIGLKKAHRKLMYEFAERFDNVYVIDGKSLSTGTGLLVMYACDLRDSGKYSAKEIYEKCLARIPYVQASFFVDTMEYLYKGGRCSGLASFFATALKLKPSLLLKDGKIVVGKKFRGSAMSIADKYVENIFDMYDNPDLKRIFITHTSADPEVVKLVRDTVNKRYKFSEIYETIASSTITSHCGKGTLGILFINDGPHEI